MMSADPLEAALRRAMQAAGAFTDPFTLMEVATILRPLIHGGPGSLETERGRLVLESAVSHLALVFDKVNVEDPRGKAESIIMRALRECWSTGCPRG
ncbi:MAG: hypothetical protein GSR80_000397 [Desulfurococcales archaeon]|nr:hypothetical protein [Desulfurococcales archaeon]